jgi:hypothetical protein
MLHSAAHKGLPIIIIVTNTTTTTTTIILVFFFAAAKHSGLHGSIQRSRRPRAGAQSQKTKTIRNRVTRLG